MLRAKEGSSYHLTIKFIWPVLEELGFSPERIILSLEMRMKCGIGMCGRCNIGDKYVCKDGPVFSLAQLKQLPPEYRRRNAGILECWNVGDKPSL
jgi:hypothetical protein